MNKQRDHETGWRMVSCEGLEGVPSRRRESAPRAGEGRGSQHPGQGKGAEAEDGCAPGAPARPRVGDRCGYRHLQQRAPLLEAVGRPPVR